MEIEIIFSNPPTNIQLLFNTRNDKWKIYCFILSCRSFCIRPKAKHNNCKLQNYCDPNHKFLEVQEVTTLWSYFEIITQPPALV